MQQATNCPFSMYKIRARALLRRCIVANHFGGYSNDLTAFEVQVDCAKHTAKCTGQLLAGIPVYHYTRHVGCYKRFSAWCYDALCGGASRC